MVRSTLRATNAEQMGRAPWQIQAGFPPAPPSLGRSPDLAALLDGLYHVNYSLDGTKGQLRTCSTSRTVLAPLNRVPAHARGAPPTLVDVVAEEQVVEVNSTTIMLTSLMLLVSCSR